MARATRGRRQPTRSHKLAISLMKGSLWPKRVRRVLINSRFEGVITNGVSISKGGVHQRMIAIASGSATANSPRDQVFMKSPMAAGPPAQEFRIDITLIQRPFAGDG